MGVLNPGSLTYSETVTCTVHRSVLSTTIAAAHLCCYPALTHLIKLGLGLIKGVMLYQVSIGITCADLERLQERNLRTLVRKS